MKTANEKRAFILEELGPRNPYLRLLEYLCVVDIVLKVFAIFVPYTSYVKSNRVYWGEGCHKLHGFSRIINLTTKLYSIVISFIGIRASWYHSYDRLQTFRRHFIYYCLIETFCLLFVILEIGISNCSDVRASTRITYISGVFIVGASILAIYYAAWIFFIKKTSEYLQNGDQWLDEDDAMPRSFVNYGTMDDKKPPGEKVVNITSADFNHESLAVKKRDTLPLANPKPEVTMMPRKKQPKVEASEEHF